MNRALTKTGFSNVRKCLPGDSIIKRANKEMYTAEIDRFQDIIIEAQKLDKIPSVERYQIEKTKKLHRIFNFFNVKPAPIKKRRPMFPSYFWFHEKKLWNNVKMVDANKELEIE